MSDNSDLQLFSSFHVESTVWSAVATIAERVSCCNNKKLESYGPNQECQNT